MWRIQSEQVFKLATLTTADPGDLLISHNTPSYETSEPKLFQRRERQ
jgi:hypothetical protein